MSVLDGMYKEEKLTINCVTAYELSLDGVKQVLMRELNLNVDPSKVEVIYDIITSRFESPRVTGIKIKVNNNQ